MWKSVLFKFRKCRDQIGRIQFEIKTISQVQQCKGWKSRDIIANCYDMYESVFLSFSERVVFTRNTIFWCQNGVGGCYAWFWLDLAVCKREWMTLWVRTHCVSDVSTHTTNNNQSFKFLSRSKSLTNFAHQIISSANKFTILSVILKNINLHVLLISSSTTLTLCFMNSCWKVESWKAWRLQSTHKQIY